MSVIRYSRGFKIKLVQEAEEEGKCPFQISQKYKIGTSTMMRWVRRYGSGRHGKVIRVEKAGEMDQMRRLKQELRAVKEALADAHVDLALEKAYLELACQEMGQSLEDWKKKQDGRRRTGPRRPSRS